MAAVYLDNDELRGLTELLSSMDLLEDVRSNSIYSTLPAGVRQSFRMGGNPLADNFAALAKLNGIERLADGQVPLVEVLKTAAMLRHDLPQAAKIREMAVRIEQVAAGAPMLGGSVMASARKAVNEAVVHRDEKLPFAFVLRAFLAGLAVARLSVPRYDHGIAKVDASNTLVQALGTGWLIGPQLLITNHHVINARARGGLASRADLEMQVRGTGVEFDLEQGVSPATVAGPHELVAYDEALDYAVLRLGGAVPGSERFGAVLPRPPLALATQPLIREAGGDPGDPTAEEPVPVNIIQHPGGGLKQLAVRSNMVFKGDARELLYFTDTEEGSSGAPVCDDGWKVVALHRAAEYAPDLVFRGKRTPMVNAGVPICAIMKDLERRVPSVYAEISAAQAALPPAPGAVS